MAPAVYVGTFVLLLCGFASTADLPHPTNFNATSTTHGDFVDITVTWQIDSSDNKVEYYNVTLTHSNGEVTDKDIVQDRMVNFTNKLHFATYTIQVVAVFNNNGPVNGPAGLYTFTTPSTNIGPPGGFIYAQVRPNETCVGWDPPQGIDPAALKYTMEWCLDKECHNDVVTSKNALSLKDLTPYSTYNISIQPAVKDMVGTVLNATFTTLAEDWPTPENLTWSQGSTASDSINYKLSWAHKNSPVPHQRVEFQYSICDASQWCYNESTPLMTAEVSLNYSTAYLFTVTATYPLPLDQTQERISSSRKLQSIGKDDGTKPFPPWLIVVLVVGAVGAAGVGGFYFWRKRRHA